MSIGPVVHSIVVKAPPSRAFELFTRQMSRWWPAGRTIGRAPHVAIVLEPHTGGRWFERDADGNETHWGKVLAWEPPSRLLLAWQISRDWRFDPELVTEVELTFSEEPEGGTRVRLEHRQLERFGTDAARHADKLRGGWPSHLADFARFAESHA